MKIRIDLEKYPECSFKLKIIKMHELLGIAYLFLNDDLDYIKLSMKLTSRSLACQFNGVKKYGTWMLT